MAWQGEEGRAWQGRSSGAGPACGSEIRVGGRPLRSLSTTLSVRPGRFAGGRAEPGPGPAELDSQAEGWLVTGCEEAPEAGAARGRHAERADGGSASSLSLGAALETGAKPRHTQRGRLGWDRPSAAPTLRAPRCGAGPTQHGRGATPARRAWRDSTVSASGGQPQHWRQGLLIPGQVKAAADGHLSIRTDLNRDRPAQTPACQRTGPGARARASAAVRRRRTRTRNRPARESHQRRWQLGIGSDAVTFMKGPLHSRL